MGSITRLSDTTGASVGHYQYLPYGGLISSSTPLSGNPFTFTAREDDGTGLMYYRARYYDPTLQVFISQDPLGDDQRYVGGNPLAFIDPLGLDSLFFDGRSVYHYNDNAQMIGQYPATSGVTGVTDPSLTNRNPIPPGRYWIYPDKVRLRYFFEQGDWGTYKTRLFPDEQTNTLNRDGFQPGSAGCIDLGSRDKELLPKLQKNKKPIPLQVIYPQRTP